MTNIIHNYGKNAGQIWKALHTHGPLTQQELLSQTGMPMEEMYAAVGWLARENKIKRDGDYFTLDETNLTVHIGESAGKIWKLLQLWDEVNVTHIPHYLELDQTTTYAALGWLAREGKIKLTKKKRERKD